MMDTATQEIDFLVESARHDSEALGELLMRYHDCLAAIASQRLHPAVAAKCDPGDVASDTIKAAFLSFKNFRGETKREFVAWLFQIHARSIYDVHQLYFGGKKKNIRREIPIYDPNRTTLIWTDVASDDTSPTQRAIRPEMALLLIETLKRLPTRQQEAVRLRHLAGWTLEAIAAELGCT